MTVIILFAGQEHHFSLAPFVRRKFESPSFVVVVTVCFAQNIFVLLWPAFREIVHFATDLHLKIPILVLAFGSLAYFDVRRRSPEVNPKDFLETVVWSLKQTLPLYIPLAVGLSVVFLIIVTILEGVGIPERIVSKILGTPICYGTLYGPFTVTYWGVKRKYGQRLLPE